MKEYCENCESEIVSEPIIAEKEITKWEECVGEIDVPVVIYFCNQSCKDEYYFT